MFYKILLLVLIFQIRIVAPLFVVAVTYSLLVSPFRAAPGPQPGSENAPYSRAPGPSRDYV